jgi:thioredoxin 1
VFAPARVHDAIREAGSDGLVVLVFGAAWCGPCQLMERTVWTDRRVEDWLSDRRAIVLRSDADEQREEKDAFDVSAWPTVIVLRRGEVVERRVGYQTAEQVMGMLREGAGTGVVELRVVPAK